MDSEKDSDAMFKLKEEIGELFKIKTEIIDDVGVLTEVLQFEIKSSQSSDASCSIKTNSSDDETEINNLIAKSVELNKKTPSLKVKNIKHQKPLSKQHKAQTNLKENNYNCPICFISSRTYKKFCNHIMMHTDDDNITCELCKINFVTPSSFLIHFKENHYYKCKDCNKTFSTAYLRRSHSQQAHDLAPKPKYRCSVPECAKVFQAQSSLTSHLLGVHNEDKNFECNVCGEAFKNNDGLRYHKKKHRGAAHLCMYCGKTYMMRGELNYHLIKHKGLKTCMCNYCGKAFPHQKSLSSHLRKTLCGRIALQK